MQQCLFTVWLIDLLIENNKTDTKSIEHLFNDMILAGTSSIYL